MTESPLLRLQGVGRVLAGRPIVAGLDFGLARGCVLGLLGVNGAGKSTTLRMIAGLLQPSRGRILLDGVDLAEHPAIARRLLGYLPERVPLYGELRTLEYLDFCARLHGLRGASATQAVGTVIERCGLGEVRRRLLGDLSKGFQQRVGIAQALVHDPALVVLDEPASGLDPLQATSIRALIGELRREHAVLLSTHLLPDVQACCDRVAILHRGRLRHLGPLREDTAETTLHIVVQAEVDAAKWKNLGGVQDAEAVAGGGWRVRLAPGGTAAQLAEKIVRAGWGLAELRREQPGLEAKFLAVASAEDQADAA